MKSGFLEEFISIPKSASKVKPQPWFPANGIGPSFLFINRFEECHLPHISFIRSINSSYGDELRVALVDGAKLYDFDTESPEKTLLKGSIFKATVSRIETSLDAAFVNFGSERHGFLPLKDLSNQYYKKDKKGKFVCTLTEGQEIIVQVTKEERGSKGAA